MFFVAAFLIIAGVALFVAAPLSGGIARPRRAATREALELAHWRHEQALAVQGLRELEFDREMGKLADADYGSLKASLEARALEAMTAIERIQDEQRAANLAAIEAKSKPRIVKTEPPAENPAPAPVSAPAAAAAPGATPAVTRLAAETASARRARFCPQCGTRVATTGNFCGECGASLRAERVAHRASQAS